MKAMKAEAERVQTIEVTHAVRDTRSNGLRVKKGDVIGLINDKLEVAGGDYAEAVNQALETPLGEGLAGERRSFYFLFATDDQKEGMKAFLEKRKPEFRGR